MTALAMDNRQVAVAARLARFAAHTGQPVTACPYHGDSDDGRALRRVWLATYLRINPPAAGTMMAAVSSQPVAGGDPEAQQLQQQWLDAKAGLLQQWPQTAQPMVDELADQAQTAADSGDISGLGSLAVSAGVLAAVALVLGGKSRGLAGLAAASVVAQAAAQGVTVMAPVQAAAERVRQTADAFARIIAAGYASGAARAALQLAGGDPTSVREAVREHLADLSSADQGFVSDNIAALLSAAQHAGRLVVLQQHPATAYAAVEINDQHRCQPCADISGHQYPTLADALEDYPASGYRRCLGGTRCRGYVRPIWSKNVAAGTPDVMAHLPGKHNQATHGNRFKIPGDRSSGIRHHGSERHKSSSSEPGSGRSHDHGVDHGGQDRPAKGGKPSAAVQQRAHDFAGWKEGAAKSGTRVEGGATQRERRIAELQAEADQAAARHDKHVAEETEKLKRKRLSAVEKQRRVNEATAQTQIEANHAQRLVELIRTMPQDPAYFDKVTGGKKVLAQPVDDRHPLAVYGDMLHIEDESAIAHQHLSELDTVPSAFHASFAAYAANAREPGGLFIGDKAVPDLDDMGHLRHQQPRGWPAGSTWSQVPGAADPHSRKVMLGGGGKGHGSTSLALHEFGHGADSAIGEQLGGGRASATPEWQALQARIAQEPGASPYYKQPGAAGQQEAWAEAFAGWSKGRQESTGAAARIRITFGVNKGLGDDIAAYFDQVQQQVSAL